MAEAFRPWHRTGPENVGGQPYTVMLTEDGCPAGTASPTPAGRIPWFTVLAILACVVVLLGEFFENARGVQPGGEPPQDCYLQLHVNGWLFCAASIAVNPFLGPANDTLARMGAKETDRIVHDGEVWRLVAPLFLHAGLVHLAVNAAALLQLGPRLEAIYGSLRVGCIYLASGVFGVIASAIMAPRSISVGASGAICGLMGASLGEVIENWNSYECPACRCCGLLSVCLLQLSMGTAPMVDNFQHVFGFCMGLVMSMATFEYLPMRARMTTSVPSKCRRHLLQTVAVSMIYLLFAAGVLALFGEWDAHLFCPWCAKLACIPFPWGCSSSSPGACWWDCNPCSAGALSANISWVGSKQNGSISLRCPLNYIGNGYSDLTVQHMDVSSFQRSDLMRLCLDKCSDVARL
mmetsp:Transcript_39549/g.113872  ORF Transcript_39549/g.113872 Transcript_39549/m.113872 type:complete len:406 (-) Transcript_39549:64-1281(-)